MVLSAAVVVTFLLLTLLAPLLPETAALIQTALLMPSLFGARPVMSPAAPAGIVAGNLPLAGAEPGAVLHIHRPRDGRHPAFVVALGLHPADPNDPRVKALLDGLAARGFAVGLVESPALDNDELAAGAPQDLVAAFQTLAGQSYVTASRTGFLGFSVGGSLALLAAANEGIAPRVRLVEALGAYSRLDSVARATLTGAYPSGGGSQAWTPDPLTRTAVPENLILLLAPESDRPALLAWLAAGMPPDRPPEVGARGAIVEHLLTATSGQAFDSALAAVPPAQLRDLQALSPLASVASVDAPVYLMVDRNDPLVPADESALLAQALRHGGRPVYFSQFDIFRHVEPTRLQPSLGLVRDVLRLFWHTHAVLIRMR